MKKALSFMLALVMAFSIPCTALAVEEDSDYVTRFGVTISADCYQTLIRQGLSEEDIDYLNEDEYSQYLSEAGGELVNKVETYYICKEDGTNIPVSQGVAELTANNLNLGIVPLEDDAGYDSANDGVCKLSFVLYKSSTAFRSTATVSWLTDPSVNAQDILGIVHNDGLITDGDDVTTTMWYDWSNDGVKYTTNKGTADSIETKVGSGVACKFNRTVISPKYNVACKNFRYRVVIRSTKNSSTLTNAIVQADYYRGIKKLSTSLDVNTIAVIAAVALSENPLAAISLVPKYESSFADVLQADIMYTINP